MKSAFIAIAAVAALFGSSVASADVDNTTLHVVDYTGDAKWSLKSIMFRGNSPLTADGKAVNFDQWYRAMSDVARTEIGSILAPADRIYIVDIGFEDPGDVVPLAEFWKDPKNAARGEYYPWPYYGMEDYPPAVTPEEQNARVRDYSMWGKHHIPSRVAFVNMLMKRGPPEGFTQLVVYTHCISGWNKVGTFADLYRISHFKRIDYEPTPTRFTLAAPPAVQSLKADPTTLTELYALGCTEGKRCPVKGFTSIVGWYCLWSNAFQGTKYTDCTTGYTCDASGCLPTV